jgi:hypothetical protein
VNSSGSENTAKDVGGSGGTNEGPIAGSNPRAAARAEGARVPLSV